MSTASSLMAEKKWTIGELADEWKTSKDTIRRLFNDEPGTIDLSSMKEKHEAEQKKKNGKRSRHQKNLLIPQSVVERVLRRRTQA